MLDLLGVNYLMDVCFETINAQRAEEIYREYETDCLYFIANYLGVKINRQYSDIIHPKPVDTRTGMEIAIDKLAQFGIEVVD